jgi:hypothetical protein
MACWVGPGTPLIKGACEMLGVGLADVGVGVGLAEVGVGVGLADVGDGDGDGGGLFGGTLGDVHGRGEAPVLLRAVLAPGLAPPEWPWDGVPEAGNTPPPPSGLPFPLVWLEVPG